MDVPATTVTVDKQTRDRLIAAKFDGGYRNLDALIRDLLAEHRLARLRATSDLLRRRMKEKGVTLRDLIR